MTIQLLGVTIVIITCLIFNKISNKIGIPMLLAFIFIGMFFGSDGIVKIHFDNYEFAEKICSIALIFIIFYGGFGTKWAEAKPVALKAVLLSSVGVMMTAGLVGIFCYSVLKMAWQESMLLGAVISSTDAASVFSILRSKRLNLKYNTASLLELESGSNDPFSYMLTVLMLSLMGDPQFQGGFGVLLTKQIGLGIIFGVGIAILALWILKHFTFETSGFDTIFVFAIALLAYAGPMALGGNGYLSVYITGIIIGNQPIPNKSALVHFFDGMTGLVQMLIFFLLGLLAFPSQMPSVILPAIAVFLFLTLVARPLAVALLLWPFGCSIPNQLVISMAGLRGAASIVFAIMATVSPAYTQFDIFHMVFCIVLLSILFQGSLLPMVSKRLNMLSDGDDVLKTFNDYTEEVPLQFFQIELLANHPWVEKKINEIVFPPETLVVMIQRSLTHILPKGKTLLLEGDIVVMGAKKSLLMDSMPLVELKLFLGHPWTDRYIADLDFLEGQLIVVIERNKQLIIPRGQTLLQAGDLLIMSTKELLSLA